jgi:cytochrome c oxidase assembly protein Cox11
MSDFVLLGLEFSFSFVPIVSLLCDVVLNCDGHTINEVSAVLETTTLRLVSEVVTTALDSLL